jgi:hypothetical protein
VSRATLDIPGCPFPFTYEALTLYGRASQPVRLEKEATPVLLQLHMVYPKPTYNNGCSLGIVCVWAPPRSLAAT